MQNTTNFNLNKPEGTDVYDIQNENDNMDIIDAALAKSYFTDDSASTELANADYLPFFDTSANEKKKMLLSTARKDVRARIAESVSNDVMETIGGTALNSYSVGQYFLGNDGYYYVATSAITAGSSTISTGVSGNCSKTSIAAGMNSLTSQISNFTNITFTEWATNWQRGSASNGFVKMGIAYCNLYAFTYSTGWTKDAWIKLCKINVAPSQSLYFSCDASTSDSTVANMNTARFRILTDGTIELLTRDESIKSICGVFIFKIA